ATFLLASSGAQPDVRQVGDVVADPGHFGRGSFVLVGVPQPAQVPVTTAQGVQLAANAAWSNETRTTPAWSRAGPAYYRTDIRRVEAGPGHELRWSFRNETRHLPADAQLAMPAVTATWSQGTAGQAFPVQAFSTGAGGPARVWALYGKATENPLQPKPAQ